MNTRSIHVSLRRLALRVSRSSRSTSLYCGVFSSARVRMVLKTSPSSMVATEAVMDRIFARYPSYRYERDR